MLIFQGVSATAYTFPETNKFHWKMDGWNTTFVLGRPFFRGELLVLGRILEVFQYVFWVGKCGMRHFDTLGFGLFGRYLWW